MRAAAFVAVVLLLSAPVAVAVPPTPTPEEAAATADIAAGPRVVAIYPNPALANDRGEFVVLVVPADAPPGNLTLSDGEAVVRLPPGHPTGRLAIATDAAARDLTDAPVVLVEAPLRLANGGERLTLRAGDRVVDRVTYPRAPEGAVYRRTPSGWAWRRLGATAFSVRRVQGATARLFVLPDAPQAALEPLSAAEDRLWLAGYTLTSRRVVAALCAARDRGVDVRVLVDREPVGGLTAAEAARLDRLAACGVAVRVVGGPGGRYTFHHAKYAVADDRAVVLTENWKPSGVGGRSSRGWGAVVADPAVAAALAETFAADAGWRDARPWLAVRAGRTYTRSEPPANGSFAPAFTPVAAEDVGVEVVVAPDNAERRVVGLLDGAESSIRVVQVSVGGPHQPFVRALVRAARRGFEDRLLLADVWYVREHNRRVADTLNRRAREADLPLQVRLASPRGRYAKIHAKGAVVDGERVLVGSLNWNNVSARQNREVALVLHGEAAGRFYARVFDADWQGGRWRVPGGLLVAAAAFWLVAGAFAVRRIEFDADEGVAPAGLDDENRLY